MTELQEQGWIDTVPNIGTFVQNPKLSKSHSNKVLTQLPHQASYRYRKELILDMPISETQGKYYFTDGTVDDEVIDIAELVRFYATVLKRKKRIHFYRMLLIAICFSGIS